MTAAAVDLISQAPAVCRQRIADAKKATEGPWEAYDNHGRDISDEGWSVIGVKSATKDVCLTYPAGVEHDDHEADAHHIANHSPDKVLPWWEWALEQFAIHESDTKNGYPACGWCGFGDPCHFAESLATAIVGSHE